MRIKKLNEAQEIWLYKNYRNKSNKELAEKLSEMVALEIKKEIARCYDDLGSDLPFHVQKRIASRIRTLLQYKSISVDYVKRRAREMGCAKKSPLVRSRSNRRNATSAHWKNLIAKAEIVTSPYDWFNSFKLEEQKVGKCTDESKFDSLRSSLCKWNSKYGSSKGIVLVGEWNRELLMGRVYAKSMYR